VEALAECTGPLTRDALLRLAELTRRFGELVTGIGEMEEKVGSFDKLLTQLKDVEFWQAVTSKLEKDPKLSATFGALFVRTLLLYPSMQKQFSDMSPREKVELGKGIIAVSELLEEIIQEGRWHSPTNPLNQPPNSVV
jgi:hypothetical protein